MVAIVVHRNRPDAVADTVGRLRAQSESVSVTVIDNASAPEHRRRLDELLTDTAVLDAGGNAGFGPGANVGLRRWLSEGGAPYAVVMPHDPIFGDDVLARIVRVLDADPTIGMASADVGDGATPTVHPWLGALAGPTTTTEGFDEGDYAHGTLMVLRRTCIEDVGMFDERYFAYCEEADLGLRARRAGWRVGVVRGADVHNPAMGSTAALIDYLQLRNTYLLVRDHWGRAHAGFRFGVAVVELAVGVVSPGRRSPFFSPRARLRALVDVARGRYGVPPSWLFATRAIDQTGIAPASTDASRGRTRRR